MWKFFPLIKGADVKSKNTKILHSFSVSEMPPCGGAIVWNPTGTSQLKSVYGPFSISPSYPGALNFQEALLLLDDVPLIRRQATECPTCEQLLQIGCGSQELALQFADAINQLTVADIKQNSPQWLERLFPIIRLRPTGLFLITVDEYIPTDGDGNFFWGAFQSIRRCSALSCCVDVTQRPVFLAPTQPTSCFQHASLSRAQQEFPQKPGLTLQLSAKISALLDGHHRALCAALQHATFPCITFQFQLLALRSGLWCPRSLVEYDTPQTSQANDVAW